MLHFGCLEESENGNEVGWCNGSSSEQQSSHAVVATSFAEDSVTVNDPGSPDPDQMVPAQEFFDAWRSTDFVMLVIQPFDKNTKLKLIQN